jgi:hypothetical protein
VGEEKASHLEYNVDRHIHDYLEGTFPAFDSRLGVLSTLTLGGSTWSFRRHSSSVGRRKERARASHVPLEDPAAASVVFFALRGIVANSRVSGKREREERSWIRV